MNEFKVGQLYRVNGGREAGSIIEITDIDSSVHGTLVQHQMIKGRTKGLDYFSVDCPFAKTLELIVPCKGERYRHFKGGLYTVLCVASHSETGEKLVIYQRDKDGSEYSERICARPLEMFMSRVDKDKYPDAKQEWRFEKIEFSYKRGKWKINSDGYYPYCSECGNEPPNRTMTDYCPCCGAKMEGKI